MKMLLEMFEILPDNMKMLIIIKITILAIIIITIIAILINTSKIKEQNEMLIKQNNQLLLNIDKITNIRDLNNNYTPAYQKEQEQKKIYNPKKTSF